MEKLESNGVWNIIRCAQHCKRPLHDSNTLRARTIEEVLKLATQERFNLYKNGKSSPTMIDHYYDKLLHIGPPQCLKSQNKYILQEANRRNAIMATFVVEYWKANE